MYAPSSGRGTASVPGRRFDGEDSAGAVLADGTHTGTERHAQPVGPRGRGLTPLPCRGWTDDARFLRDGTSRLLAVRTEEAADRLDLIDPADGSARPITPGFPGAGHLRIRGAEPHRDRRARPQHPRGLIVALDHPSGRCGHRPGGRGR